MSDKDDNDDDDDDEDDTEKHRTGLRASARFCAAKKRRIIFICCFTMFAITVTCFIVINAYLIVRPKTRIDVIPYARQKIVLLSAMIVSFTGVMASVRENIPQIRYAAAHVLASAAWTACWTSLLLERNSWAPFWAPPHPTASVAVTIIAATAAVWTIFVFIYFLDLLFAQPPQKLYRKCCFCCCGCGCCGCDRLLLLWRLCGRQKFSPKNDHFEIV